MSIEVADNPGRDRYEVRVDGELAGFAQYRVEGRRMTIFHAEVDSSFEGRGVGSRLAEGALDDLRSRGLELIPRCPFIAAFVRKHHELYLDLVPGPLRERFRADDSGSSETPAGDR